MTDMRKALDLLAAIKWQSADKDNMEFTARVSCYQRDALDDVLAALAAPGGEPVAWRVPDSAWARGMLFDKRSDADDFARDISSVVELLYRHPEAGEREGDRIWNEAVEACMKKVAGVKSGYVSANYSFARGYCQAANDATDAIAALRRPAATKRTADNSVIAEIAAERRRQIEVEDWTPEHDDAHTDGSLAQAAASYANPYPETYYRFDGRVPRAWPSSWNASWWKPKDRRRDLIRAAALIVAEIERLDRRPAATSQAGGQP